MTRRIVIHNTFRRNIGTFRATAPVRDHGCSCGGSCDDCRDHARDDYDKCSMAVDVVYSKGDAKETRHYVVPDVLVDPRGYTPPPGAVADALLRQRDHQSMLKAGWKADSSEGYYKR